MRIAQVAPLYERVPPLTYGGTERVVSYMVEELVRRGHEVTLFASGDSLTGAVLESPCARSLRLDPDCVDKLAPHYVMLERVYKNPSRFDIIHFHIDYLHFPLSRRSQAPHCTTLHGRLDIPDLRNLYKEYREMPVISISNSQRRSLPWLNWQGTVYHGLPLDLYTCNETPGTYLAFLGRVSPEKRVDQAIAIARDSGIKLKIAAKIDEADRPYFEQRVRPLLKGPGVEFVGEIGEHEKNAFLGNALALLFPIDWEEPFGLVMIESLACGTPVIAYPRGSVPEIIQDGITGFLAESREAAKRAVENAAAIDRKRCRRIFEERFSVSRMVRSYLALYEQIISERKLLFGVRQWAPRRRRGLSPGE